MLFAWHKFLLTSNGVRNVNNTLLPVPGVMVLVLICLSVLLITAKVIIGFAINFHQRCVSGQGTINLILVMIRITVWMQMLCMVTKHIPE